MASVKPQKYNDTEFSLFMQDNSLRSFVCIFEDTFDAKDICVAGKGNSKLRPFSKTRTPTAFGITCAWNRFQMFSSLGVHERQVIDLSFERLKHLINYHAIETVYYYVCDNNNNFYCKDYELSDDVIDYITQKLNDLSFSTDTVMNLSKIVEEEKNLIHFEETSLNKVHALPVLQKTIRKKYIRFGVSKLFPGAPTLDTNKSTGFPFFCASDYDINGSLIDNSYVYKNTGCWPNIPWDQKIYMWKDWCAFKSQEVAVRGSLEFDNIWEEWLYAKKNEYADIFPS